MMDFILALKRGVQNYFAHLNINNGLLDLSGCSFQFMKAIFTHVQELGLSKAYFAVGTGLKANCRLLYVLPHVPAQYVSVVFEYIVEQYTPVKFNAWTTHFRNQWLAGNADFPIDDWNLYLRVDHWINNKTEGNNRYLGFVQGVHPRILQFTYNLLTMYRDKMLAELTHRRGIQPESRKRDDKIRLERVNFLKEMFRQQGETIENAKQLPIVLHNIAFTLDK